MNELKSLFPLAELLGRIKLGEASEIELTPEDAVLLIRFLAAVDEVVEWHRDHESVPSLNALLQILWRSRMAIEAVNV